MLCYVSEVFLPWKETTVPHQAPNVIEVSRVIQSTENKEKRKEKQKWQSVSPGKSAFTPINLMTMK